MPFENGTTLSSRVSVESTGASAGAWLNAVDKGIEDMVRTIEGRLVRAKGKPAGATK